MATDRSIEMRGQYSGQGKIYVYKGESKADNERTNKQFLQHLVTLPVR